MVPHAFPTIICVNVGLQIKWWALTSTSFCTPEDSAFTFSGTLVGLVSELGVALGGWVDAAGFLAAFFVFCQTMSNDIRKQARMNALVV